MHADSALSVLLPTVGTLGEWRPRSLSPIEDESLASGESLMKNIFDLPSLDTGGRGSPPATPAVPAAPGPAALARSAVSELCLSARPGPVPVFISF